MTEISEAERRERFAAEWRATPAPVRKSVGLAWLCGLLWSVRILENASVRKGIDGHSIIFAMAIFFLYFGGGFAAPRRQSGKFLLLIGLTLFSFYGPIVWLCNVARCLMAGIAIPYFSQFTLLSVAELAAGIALLACLFWPSTIRRVWGKEAVMPLDPPV